MIEGELDDLDIDTKTCMPVWTEKYLAVLSLTEIDKKQNNQTMMKPNNGMSPDRDRSCNENFWFV